MNFSENKLAQLKAASNRYDKASDREKESALNEMVARFNEAKVILAEQRAREEDDEKERARDEMRKIAETFVRCKDAPACLLDPLSCLLDTYMSEADEERLLAEGIETMKRFFAEWEIVRKIFTGTNPIDSIGPIQAAMENLAESLVEGIPAPIPVRTVQKYI